MLPGWYGFDSAVASSGVLVSRLSEMHAAWPFFATTLANMETVLAKGDMDIAARYGDGGDWPLAPPHGVTRPMGNRD